MNFAANCKFCGCNLVLQVDDVYAELGDPYKILKLAACNRCADLRGRKRRLDNCIRKVCMDLIGCSSKDLKGVTAYATSQLDALTRKYCVLVSDWYSRSGIMWDEAFPALLIEKPERVNDILAQYWKSFKQSNNIKF